MNVIKWTPNPAQERFLRAFRPHRQLLLCSGVGVGKTFVLAFAAFRLAWLNPGVRGLVVSHILSHVRTEIIPPLIKLLKESRLYDHEIKMDRTIVLKNGAEIQYGSADRPDSLDGKNTAWLVGDEVRYWPYSSYEKATSRVRQKGAAYPMQAFTTTPEMNWIYDTFHDQPDKIVLHAHTKENLDNLQEGYYARLKSSLSPGTYEQYVEGNWRSAKGTVYGEEFSLEDSVDALPHIPGLPVYIGYDPGVQSPAVVFVQALPWCDQHQNRECLHVLAELCPDDCPVSRMIPLIQDLAARKNWNVTTVYLDPFGGNQRDQIYGTRVSDVLEKHGWEVVFSYDPSQTNVLNGIEVVRSRLLNAEGKRRLYFDRSLIAPGHTNRNLIRAMQGYKWPERKPGQPVKSNPVHDETSHIQDALRYVNVNLYPFADMVFVG